MPINVRDYARSGVAAKAMFTLARHVNVNHPRPEGKRVLAREIVSEYDPTTTLESAFGMDDQDAILLTNAADTDLDIPPAAGYDLPENLTTIGHFLDYCVERAPPKEEPPAP